MTGNKSHDEIAVEADAFSRLGASLVELGQTMTTASAFAKAKGGASGELTLSAIANAFERMAKEFGNIFK